MKTIARLTSVILGAFFACILFFPKPVLGLSTNAPPQKSYFPDVQTWANPADPTFSFPKFDPSLGSLRRVEIEYSGTVSCPQIYMTNTSSTFYSTATVIFTNWYKLTGPQFSYIYGWSFSVASALSGHQSILLTPSPSVKFISAPTLTFLSSQPSVFTNFSGQGQISMPMGWFAGPNISCSQSSCSSINPDFRGWQLSVTVFLRYVFEPYPNFNLSLSALGLNPQSAVLSWASIPNSNYVVEANPSLLPNSWLAISTNKATNSFSQTIVSTNLGTEDHNNYRVWLKYQ